MPPKTKTTKESIVSAAMDIVREQGDAALNARTVAAALGCSTQPIFSNFASMQELRLAVANAAEKLYCEYIEKETQSGLWPPYKASGMAYIRFAKEEKQLFKLLFMRDRTAEEIPQETELGNWVVGVVQGNTGLEEDRAKLFHLEMWAYTHGIAVMVATDYLDLDWELISLMLTDAYQGLRKRFEKE